MIEINSLTVSYHRAPPVLKGISLRVDRGEVVNVLGPNGCGKTTLLRALLGLLPVPSGSIVLDGCPLEKMARVNSW